MNSALTADDFAGLDNTQKEAVLTTIYTALIADGSPNEHELAKFTEAIARLPWGQPVEELRSKMKAVQTRLASATREDKLAFLEETARNVPVPVRERVIETMVAIASADKVLTPGEKGSISSFIRAFGLSQAQIDALRSKLRAE